MVAFSRPYMREAYIAHTEVQQMHNKVKTAALQG
jgi:hypothetical protein